tara:strand:+ start:386 stop:1465 length:1080 start_codon:yes stop_codon:yes gene_type:complete
MIKLKDILKESKKVLLSEAFKSSILRSLVNKWSGLDDTFFNWGASKGIQWDKIEDYQIEKLTKAKRKGLEIVVAGKKVTMPGKKDSYWGYTDVYLNKGNLITILLNGKPQYYTHGYGTRWGSGTSDKEKARKVVQGRRTAKVGAGGDFLYDEKKQWGLDTFGYRSLSAISSIPGVQFYHIDLSEDRPYMGAGEVRKLRYASRVGAQTFMTAGEFKKAQDVRMKELLQKKVDDPQRIEASLKKANTYARELIDVVLGGKINKKFNDIINRFTSTSNRRNDEAATYELLDHLTGNLDLMYRRYGEYLEYAAKVKEKQKEQGKLFDPKFSDDYESMTRTAKAVLNVSKAMQGKDLRKLDNIY